MIEAEEQVNRAAEGPILSAQVSLRLTQGVRGMRTGLNLLASSWHLRLAAVCQLMNCSVVLYILQRYLPCVRRVHRRFSLIASGQWHRRGRHAEVRALPQKMSQVSCNRGVLEETTSHSGTNNFLKTAERLSVPNIFLMVIIIALSCSRYARGDGHSI